MTAARILLLLSTFLAASLARRLPRHRPIAAALLITLAVSAARAALPEARSWARASLALLVAPACAGAWAAAAALRACPRAGTLALGAWVAIAAAIGLGARPAAWWSGVLPAVYLLGAVAQAAAIVRWALREDRAVTVTERTLLALLAGDVVATVAPLLGGGPWELARIASGAALLGACVVQGAALRLKWVGRARNAGRVSANTLRPAAANAVARTCVQSARRRARPRRPVA